MLLKSNVRLQCSNAICSNYKMYSCYKTREKGCMAMIVCERVSGNIIAFLLVSEELSLAWQFACPEPG